MIDLSKDTIIFKNISLSYTTPPVNALTGINFQIKPKQKVILLGPSGSGKSSILNLLLNFISPLDGSIAINQTDLKDIDKTNWYSQISFLGQLPRLFSGTLYDNLLMAKTDATDFEIKQVIEDVKLQSLVEELPQGLNTNIGENHMGLSGGQAQRFALARTLLKDAPFMIFDEPTQSLDYEHETLIIEMLKNHIKDKTVVMATHRLDHLEYADLILVLNDGKITQCGDYQTLVNEPQGYLRELLALKDKSNDV